MPRPKNKKTPPRYMARSTLSDRKAEKLIWLFVTNACVSQAAHDVGVSVKCAKLYYDLLLDRLIELGYFQNEGMLTWMLRDNHEYCEQSTEFVDTMIAAHRGLEFIPRQKYAAKYASIYFYRFLYQDAAALRIGTSAVYELIYRDVIDAIRLSGPLNRSTDFDGKMRARVHLGTSIARRIARALKRRFALEMGNVEDEDHPGIPLNAVFEYFHGFNIARSLEIERRRRDILDLRKTGTVSHANDGEEHANKMQLLTRAALIGFKDEDFGAELSPADFSD